jgi:hypothetical protein
MYEDVPLEQAEKFWAKRNKLLKARSDALLVAMLGQEMAPQWWTTPNRAFEQQTPNTQSIERVYGYLMSRAEGEW